MNKRGVSIIENIIAMALFTGAFIFTVYSMANLVTPLLGEEEAASMQIVTYNSVERILTDPSAGLIREDHVISFDKLSTFLIREDEKYEELQTYLGIEEYNFKIIIASTFSRISTYGMQEDGTNDPYIVTGSDTEEGETYNDVITYGDPDNDGTAEYKYNIEEFIVGDKKYDILTADSTDDNLVNYDRFYIDYDKDMWFTDEEHRGYGNLREGESFSIEGVKYTVIGITENEVELLEEGAVDMELGEGLPYAEGEERVYLLKKPVVVLSRLVLVASEEGNEVKRLVFMMW